MVEMKRDMGLVRSVLMQVEYATETVAAVDAVALKRAEKLARDIEEAQGKADAADAFEQKLKGFGRIDSKNASADVRTLGDFVAEGVKAR